MKEERMMLMMMMGMRRQQKLESEGRLLPGLVARRERDGKILLQVTQ
jgi:hypothetical protein